MADKKSAASGVSNGRGDGFTLWGSGYP